MFILFYIIFILRVFFFSSGKEVRYVNTLQTGLKTFGQSTDVKMTLILIKTFNNALEHSFLIKTFNNALEQSFLIKTFNNALEHSFLIKAFNNALEHST